MIGQTKLLEQLNTYNIDTFPRSTLFIGERGMGRHTLINHICQSLLKIPLIILDESQIKEQLEGIYLNSLPTAYLIDIDNMAEVTQNTLLKLIEEPPSNVFLFLICENPSLPLITVTNRCINFILDPYSDEELSCFLEGAQDKDLILKVLRSPGKLITSDFNSLQKVYNYCNLIVQKIQEANYINTLSIASKINYADEFDKFDIDIFFKTLLNCMFESYKKSNSSLDYKLYMYTCNEYKKLINKKINRKIFMNNYLSGLWQLSRGSNYERN